MDQSDIAVRDRQVEVLAGAVERLQAALARAQASGAAAATAVLEWEALFDALPDAVAVIDHEHRIIRMNRVMAARLKIRREEAVGRLCHELVHASGAPPAFCPHALALQDGQSHAAEIYEPALDGFFLVTASPLLDAAGRPAATVHVIRQVAG